MGRSGARSEYGKQFSPKRSMLSCNQSKVYEDNVGYRAYRRKMEHWHSHDPFCWDTRTPPHVSSASGRSTSSSSAGEGDEVSSPDNRNKYGWQQRDEMVQTPADWSDDDLPKTPPPKPVSQTRRKTAPPAVSKEAVPRVKTPPEPSALHPPFLSYGHGYRGVETGDKKTFNLKAGNAVYQASLRAQKRRQAEIRLRAKEKKRAPLRVKRDEALFNERVARDTDRWTTEYRTHFPAHSRREYERNLSARKLGGVTFDANM